MSNSDDSTKQQHVSHLKPFLGIQPIVYIPTIFLCIGIGVIFLACVYPGLAHYGSRLHIESLPRGAAIFVDNKLVGSTPYQGFMHAGNIKIRLEKVHFRTKTSDLSIKGRRIFSLFFPKKHKYSVTLDLDNLNDVLVDSYYQASSWYSLPEDKNHQRPSIILDTTKDLIQTRNLTEDRNWQSLITTWVIALRDLIQDEGSWKEITEVWTLLKNSEIGILVPKSLEVVREASSFAEVLRKLSNKKMPIMDSKTELKSLGSSILVVSGLTFKAVQASTLTMGQSGEEDPEYYVHQVFIPAFYYLDSYFSISDYRNLTKDRSIVTEFSPYTSIPHVKIHLVLDKLNFELTKQGYQNLHARLPSEVEWQYLAQNQRIFPRYFEWTSDNYLPYRALYYPGIASFPQPFDTYEKVIRGQSDFSGELPVWMRAGFPIRKDAQSIAFRIVIAPKPTQK